MDHMLAPPLERTARDAAYLSLGLLTSILAFAVWVTALALSVSLIVFVVGVPIVLASAFVMRWTAELDRRNAELVFGRPIRGHYRKPTVRGWLPRLRATVTDPQTWRDLAWLITHSVIGFAFGVLAVTLIGSIGFLASLPIWYWAPPEGVEFGLWQADTLPIAIVSAFLAVPVAFMTVWVLRGLATFHASLAVELLGRY
jgi:hypothetical protein